MKKICFLKCEKCGNVASFVVGDVDNIVCCENKMQAIIPQSELLPEDKHNIDYERVEDEIFVTMPSHPMTKEHYIMWIAQVTDNTLSITKLYPEQNIEIRFKYIPGSKLYAYCNNHGLYLKEVK